MMMTCIANDLKVKIDNPTRALDMCKKSKDYKPRPQRPRVLSQQAPPLAASASNNEAINVLKKEMETLNTRLHWQTDFANAANEKVDALE